MQKPNTIGIDFDGTICQKQSFGDGKIWQKPMPNVKKVLSEMKQCEYKLVIFTVRLNPDMPGDVEAKKKEIERWLLKHEIPYDDLTNNKPSAVAYIDDRAIRFTNWEDISNYFIQ